MISFFYNLLIQPLVFIYELVFTICCNYLSFHYESVDDYVLIGIIVVSAFVNILSLPLYNAADDLQKKECEKEKKIEKVASHIKKNFKSDERIFILSSYYRLEKYNPIYQLKTAIPLLLQIPFFTAAYIFFTNATIFKGMPLYCVPLIRDLSKPDMLLVLNSYAINILPIIMTVINFISSLIYTKNLSFKDKLQPIILALIFFVLLYNSSSALVIYWTFNNIFSLFKNIISYIVEKKSKKLGFINLENKSIKDSNTLALVSLLIILVLLAIFIPLNIISSSPTEFTVSTPFNILRFTLTIFAGYFLWELLYYKMISIRFKRIVASFIFSLSIYLLINHFIFVNDFGNISETLVYSEGFKRFNMRDIGIDICIMILSFAVLIISLKFTKIALNISALVLLSILAVSSMNIYKTVNKMKHFTVNNYVAQSNDDKKRIEFSKNGKNVIVIMLDRSCGAYFNFVMSNRPELKHTYDGFTFFDNTISCGSETLIGSPPLFGGYDYLPQNSNERKNTLLVDKHNEALTIMPYNFSKNGFNCVVANLPYVNYDLAERESPFSHLNKISEINLTDGASKHYSDYVNHDINAYSLNRNFVFYGIMKTVPIIAKGLIYSDGYYLTQNIALRLLSTITNYYVFDNFIEKITFMNDSQNNFVMFDNELTHNHNNNVLPYDTFSPYQLERVNKILKFPVKNNSDGECFIGDYAHLSTEVAAYMQIGKILDYLKKNDAYDNTRIIIASDHGKTYNQNVENKYYFEYETSHFVPVANFNPVLLYKDFNSHGELVVNNAFMTNADTPILAMDGIINNPINPYLDRIISDVDKNIKEIDLYSNSKGWDAKNYLDDFIFTNYRFSCHTIDIFDKDNWYTKKEVESYD